MALRHSLPGALAAATYLTAAVLLTRDDGMGLATAFVTLPWSLLANFLPDWIFYTRLWEKGAFVVFAGVNAILLYGLFGGWRADSPGDTAAKRN